MLSQRTLPAHTLQDTAQRRLNQHASTIDLPSTSNRNSAPTHSNTQHSQSRSLTGSSQPRNNPIELGPKIEIEEQKPAENDVDERPIKRVRYDKELEANPSGHQSDEHHGEQLPYPPQPTRQENTRRKTVQGGSVRRADGITPPPMATILANNVTADFCPWTGNHAEDVINEQAIKGGYCDKGPSSNQNECSSARASIWPSLTLKNNVALHTLSLIFTQALDRRQSVGRIKAPSSFKPPPRVTVTDTKREAWLRDLANPNVSLKKQSRTIPHGIRGRVLLEQCLLKSISLQRGVWLAKCVGANELRAFRRKGVSGSAAAQGEAKWIREWTLCVTQFLEEILRSTSQDSWRARVDYTVKFVAVLFSEGLIEQNLFLNWLVSSMKNATLELLPVWLFPTRVFWAHIIAVQYRGRRLALALLEHLDSIRACGHSLYGSIQLQLQKLIAAIATQTPGCLLIPSQWNKHRQLILESASLAPGAIHNQIYAKIQLHNERLSIPTQASKELVKSPLHILHNLLNAVDVKTSVEEFTQTCHAVMPSIDQLVKSLLEWACSRYRTDRARVTLTLKILEKLASSGHDIEPATLAFLTNVTTKIATIDRKSIVLVVRQLAIAGCFPTGRFMQWLITSGTLASDTSTQPYLNILLALPTKHLSRSLLNTRDSLLARSGYVQAIPEEQVLRQMETCLEQQRMQLDQVTMAMLDDIAFTDCVSTWVLSTSARLFKEGAMIVSTFSFMRQTLEVVSDVNALRTILQLASHSTDFRIIGAAADTLNTHVLEMALHGSLNTLTQGLVEQYRCLRRQQSLERSCIYALRNLIKDIGNDAATVAFLNADIAIYEQQNLNSVCSPASDSLIGMHANNMNSDSEIEAVFASGNTMDMHLMQRVLIRVTQRAEELIPSDTDERSLVCRWLVQLRMLDRLTFDKIAGKHVLDQITLPYDGKGFAGIYAMIAADCFGYQALTRLLGEEFGPQTAGAVLSLVAAPLPPSLCLNTLERYHLEQQRTQFRQQHSDLFARLLQRSLELPLADDVNHLVGTVLELHTAGSDHLDHLSTACASNAVACDNLKTLCSMILTHSGSRKHSITPREVMNMSTPLNIALCAGWLRCAGTSSAHDEHEIREALLRSVVDASPVWPDLLKSATDKQQKSIHDWAMEQLLKSDAAIMSSSQVEALSLCCQLLDITMCTDKQEDHSTALSAIALKLRSIGKSLSGRVEGDTRLDVKDVIAQLRLLLHVVMLFTQNITKTDAMLQNTMHTVLALCALLAQEKLQEYNSVIQHIHDVTSQVIDKLPSEALPRLQKSLSNAGLHHQSFKQLLGVMADSYAGLALATPAPGLQQRGTLSRQQSQMNARVIGTPQATQLPALSAQSSSTSSSTQQGKQTVHAARPGQSSDAAVRYAPYGVRIWEIMQDPTPVVGENDSSISLALFGARKI